MAESISLFPCAWFGPILTSFRAGCKINVISKEFSMYCNTTNCVKAAAWLRY